MKISLPDPSIFCRGKTDPVAFKVHEHLQQCFEVSKDQIHSIVSEVEEADLVVIGVQGSLFGSCFERIRSHSLFRQAQDKTVIYCPNDNQFPAVPGLYPSIAGKWVREGWARPFHYLSTHLYKFKFKPEELLKKDIACSFVGSSQTNTVRREIMRLCRSNDIYLFDSSSDQTAFWWERKDADFLRSHYRDILRRSLCALCPCGISPSSIRLYEVMEAGAVPIIISDKIQLPDGPDWSRFCYSVKESEVDTIPDLVTSVRADLEEKGSEARRVWERYFSDEATFNYLVDQAGCLIKNHRKTCLKARIREFVSFRNIKDKVKLALGR